MQSYHLTSFQPSRGALRADFRVSPTQSLYARVNNIEKMEIPEVIPSQYSIDRLGLASMTTMPRHQTTDVPFDNLNPLHVPVAQPLPNGYATKTYGYPQPNAYQQVDQYTQATVYDETLQVASHGYGYQDYIDPSTVNTHRNTPSLTSATSPLSSHFPLSPSRSTSVSPISDEKQPSDTRVGLDYRTLLTYAYQDPYFQDWILTVADQLLELRTQATGNPVGTPLYEADRDIVDNAQLGSGTYLATMQGGQTTVDFASHDANLDATRADYEASVADDNVSAQVQVTTSHPGQTTPPFMSLDIDAPQACITPMRVPSTYLAPPTASLVDSTELHHRVAQQATQKPNSIKPTDAGTEAMLLPEVAQLLPNQLDGPNDRQTMTGVQRKERTNHRSKSLPYKKTNASVVKLVTDNDATDRVPCPAVGCTKTFGRDHEMHKHVLCSRRTRKSAAHIVIRTEAVWQQLSQKPSLKTDLPCEQCGRIFLCKYSLQRHGTTKHGVSGGSVAEEPGTEEVETEEMEEE